MKSRTLYLVFLFAFLFLNWKNVNAQTYYYGEFQKEEFGIDGKFLLTLNEDNTFLFTSKINSDITYSGIYQDQEQHIILDLKETIANDTCIYNTPKDSWNILKKVEENIEYIMNEEIILLEKITTEERETKPIKQKQDNTKIYCQELVNPKTKEGYYKNNLNEFVLYQDNHIIWYESKDNYKIGTYHVEETTLNFDFTTECIGDKCFLTNKAMDLRIEFSNETTFGGNDFRVSYQGISFKQVAKTELEKYQESDRFTKVDTKKSHYYIYIGVIIIGIIFIVSKIAIHQKK